MRNVLLHIQDGANEYLAIAVRYDKIRNSKRTTTREIYKLLFDIRKVLPTMKDRLKIHKLNSMKRYLETVRVLEDGTKIYDKHDLNRYVKKINDEIKRSKNKDEIKTLRDKLIDANRAYVLEPSIKETAKINDRIKEEVFNFRLSQTPPMQQFDKLMHEKRKFESDARRLGIKKDTDRIFFGRNKHYKRVRY